MPQTLISNLDKFLETCRIVRTESAHRQTARVG